METLGFYYHPHELLELNTEKYDIVNFFNLQENGEVDYYFKRNGRNIPIYKLHKIIGTVIAKDNLKSVVTLLTTDGVVDVKFTKDYFAKYNRQISEMQENGTKKVVEKTWFGRGELLLITGFRRGDVFQAKTYAKTPTHQIYKVISFTDNELELIHDRYGDNTDD